MGWKEEAEVERADRNLFHYFGQETVKTVWANWIVEGVARRLMGRRDFVELASGDSLTWG